ncbi:predicted protein [Postia placenta Mad-698-R]|nr:predicted protein [Postia placenta Mad-698-R]
MALRGTLACLPMLHLDRWVQVYLYFENYSYFSATALCCYDYALTLDREVKYMWRSKQSFATLLFYTCRYSAILNTALELLTRMAWPSWQSDKLRIRSTFTNGAGHRHFGHYNHSVGYEHLSYSSQHAYENVCLEVVLIVVRIIAVRDNGSIYFPAHLTGSETGMIGARAASVVSDGLVLVLTCIKTWQPKGNAGALMMDIGTTIREILLKDTALCFGLLCVVNIIGIATGHLTQFIEIWTTWTAILTSVLLSHLALDLREVSAAEGSGNEMFSRTLRTLNFRHAEESSDHLTPSDENQAVSGSSVQHAEIPVIVLGERYSLHLMEYRCVDASITCFTKSLSCSSGHSELNTYPLLDNNLVQSLSISSNDETSRWPGIRINQYLSKPRTVISLLRLDGSGIPYNTQMHTGILHDKCQHLVDSRGHRFIRDSISIRTLTTGWQLLTVRQAEPRLLKVATYLNLMTAKSPNRDSSDIVDVAAQGLSSITQRPVYRRESRFALARVVNCIIRPVASRCFIGKLDYSLSREASPPFRRSYALGDIDVWSNCTPAAFLGSGCVLHLSGGSISPAPLISDVLQLWTNVFQALCWYDFFLTLDREIKFVWKAEQSLATILFYFYRYPGLLNLIIELSGRMSLHNWQTDARCGAVLHTQMALDLMILISSSTFQSLPLCLIDIFVDIKHNLVQYIFVMSATKLDAVKQFQGCTLDIIGDQHRYEFCSFSAQMILQAYVKFFPFEQASNRSRQL